MAINYPGPFEIRLNYTTALAGQPTYEHQMRLSMALAVEGQPGDPFSAWETLNRNSSQTPLDDYVDALVGWLRPCWDANADINDCELWEYEEGTFNAAFRSVYPIALSGSGGGSAQPDGQTIVTFRSQLGGHARIDIRRPIFQIGVSQLFPTNVTVINSLATFITSTSSPVRARDNGYLFTPYKYLPGTNEHLFKDRLRP